MMLSVDGGIREEVGERAFEPCGGLDNSTQVGFKLFIIFVSDSFAKKLQKMKFLKIFLT